MMTNNNNYFKETELLAPPIQRAAYTDRMAYVLAEMSDLAYFPFEGIDRMIKDAAKEAVKLAIGKETDELENFLRNFAEKMLKDKGANLDVFENILKNADFELIKPFDKIETQGFLCRRNAADEAPYLVLAFSGTEKKFKDWLTDANAIPTQKDGYRAHTGFYKAFHLVKDDIVLALKDKRCLDAEGKQLPLYIN